METQHLKALPTCQQRGFDKIVAANAGDSVAQHQEDDGQQDAALLEAEGHGQDADANDAVGQRHHMGGVGQHFAGSSPRFLWTPVRYDLAFRFKSSWASGRVCKNDSETKSRVVLIAAHLSISDSTAIRRELRTCYSETWGYRRLHLCKQNCKQNSPATATTTAAVEETLALTLSGQKCMCFSKHLFQLRVRTVRWQRACAFLRPQESFKANCLCRHHCFASVASLRELYLARRKGDSGIETGAD